MGWQDRDYSTDDSGSGRGPIMAGGFLWPRVTPVVKTLLITNVIVFVFSNIFGIPEVPAWGVLTFREAILRTQLWRLISYQYLHLDAWHIFLNMLGLYFLGSLLEQRWGGIKFFILYTVFGIVGGGFFIALSAAGILPQEERLIGASGSILGLVGACAVAAPAVMVILFIFPVPIRTAAIIFAVIFSLSVLSSGHGGDACHLGGLAAGALWAWLEGRGLILWPSSAGPTVSGPGRKWVQVKVRKGAWEKKLKKQQARQAEIDRILQKIHERGLNSLSRREKKKLQEASQPKEPPDFRPQQLP